MWLNECACVWWEWVFCVCIIHEQRSFSRFAFPFCWTSKLIRFTSFLSSSPEENLSFVFLPPLRHQQCPGENPGRPTVFTFAVRWSFAGERTNTKAWADNPQELLSRVAWGNGCMYENSWEALEAKRTSSESLNMSKVRAVVEGVTKKRFSILHSEAKFFSVNWEQTAGRWLALPQRPEKRRFEASSTLLGD